MPPLTQTMKLLKVVRFLSTAAVLAALGWTQTRVDLRTQGKSIDFSAASYTLPSQTGPVLPATCQLGATFILTTTLAGQNWYVCTSANHWTVQGSAGLPISVGNAGSVLSTDGTSLLWNALGGDISGAPASVSVNKLLGRMLNTAVPSIGQFLGWDGAQWTAQTLTFTGGSGVASIFSRTGTVTAQNGDYTAAQVTNAAATNQANSYLAGARQTFNGSVNGAGMQVSPGPLPSVPLAGDVVVDSGDSNRMKIYSGSAWISLNPTLPPGNYTAFFTSATVVSVPGATHNLGTANLIVQCYDNASPSNLVEASQISIDPTTFTVTITFAAAETGRCVLNGYNGASNTGGSGSGAGMASQLGDFAVKWSSPATLSIGGNCSTASPCNVRFGTQIYSFTNPASATISAGSGMAYLYVDSTGALTVGSSLAVSCTTSCVSAPGITNFPVNSAPIYTWTAANGTWDSTGGVDRRGWLSASPVLAGPGIASVTVAGQTTIAADGAVLPTYLTASATLDFPSIPAGSCASDITFSLPGANAGDAVAAGWPAGLEAGLSGTMRISASGVVSVRLCAATTGAVDPASAVFTATVVRGF